jgi:spore coat protein H
MRLKLLGLVGVLAAGVACSVGEIGPGVNPSVFLAGGTGGDQGTGGAGGGVGTDTNPPVAEPGRCGPTGRAGLSVEEQDQLVAAVTCDPPLATGQVLLAALPRGATFDAATGELRWTPALDQAGSYHLLLSVAGAEMGAVDVAVLDRFDHVDNAPIADPTSYHEELGVPVFHLTVSDGIHDDDYTPATVIYRGHTYSAEAKYRGRSSSEYPKRSYTLKFSKGDKFHEPSMAGAFGSKRKLVLIADFDDNSHVRQRLAFALWNRLGAGRIKIQTFSAAVYVNGGYAGLYTVTDLIDGDLMEEHGLLEDGNLYKGVNVEANFFPNDPLAAQYEKKEGFPLAEDPGAFDDLAALGDFIMNAPEDEFQARLPELLDMADYRAWLILVTLIRARDTLGKNTYHYHNPAGGLWRTVPWDFNHSFGQSWMTTRTSPIYFGVGDMVGYNRLLQRLYRDPVVGPATVARYQVAMATEIPVATVLSLVDILAAEVAPAARRDQRKWQQAYVQFERWSARDDFTDFDSEIAYLKSWIPQRWSTLTHELETAAEVWGASAPVELAP